MLPSFKEYIHANQLFSPSDKIVLAVSGGKDSMAMLHLFLSAKFTIGVAHCNFQLRGKDADDDEHFVKQYCEKFDIPFYSTKFNTKEYATANKISTQMAARELRYAWFEEIRTSYNYQYIATAHHKNDIVETMLINLTKGTGLSGLHGIRVKSKTIIRPLLFLNSIEIMQFIKDNNIPFREDKSNSSLKYVRNKIRHEIMPKLAEINPKIVDTLCLSSTHFLEIESILTQKIEDEKRNCFIIENGITKINIKKLKQLNPLSTYLYYFLLPYRFNFSDCEQITLSLNATSGKQFFSASHQLVKDRDFLILSPKGNNPFFPIIIHSINDFEKSPIKIKYKLIENNNTAFNPLKNIAYLDYNKLVFPLNFRKWKDGDSFTPFGMKGRKKLSDYFIDEKFSIIEKENSWLLTDKNDTIIWVVNNRIAKNYCVTENTKEILLLETE